MMTEIRLCIWPSAAVMKTGSPTQQNSKKIEVVTMLIELGASVHAVNSDGKTPLYLSCEQDIKLTELLLTKGADPNTRPISSENSNGRYSRHLARAQQQHIHCRMPFRGGTLI
jgi:ankyrin repeat protein